MRSSLRRSFSCAPLSIFPSCALYYFQSFLLSSFSLLALSFTLFTPLSSSMSAGPHYRHAPRPVLHWMGNKEHLLDSIKCYCPKQISGCLSLFPGCMVILFSVLHMVETGAVKLVDEVGQPATRALFRATDVNKAVIDFHHHLRSDCRGLIRAIDFLVECFNDTGAGLTRKDSYAKLRQDYNAGMGTTSVMRSAQFYLLMRLCWYHAYREDSHGLFTASFQERHQCCLDNAAKANMYRVSALLRKYDVQLVCGSFETARAWDDDHKFLDIDPPYIQDDIKCDATSYSAPLTHQQHELLVEFAKARPNRRFVLTQSNTEWVKMQFLPPQFQVEEVGAELLISNALNNNEEVKEEEQEEALLPHPPTQAVPSCSVQCEVKEDNPVNPGQHLSQPASEVPQLLCEPVQSAIEPARAEAGEELVPQAPVSSVAVLPVPPPLPVPASAPAPVVVLALPFGHRCMAITKQGKRCSFRQKLVRSNQRGDQLGLCACHLKVCSADADPHKGLREYIDANGVVHALPVGQRQWVP